MYRLSGMKGLEDRSQNRLYQTNVRLNAHELEAFQQAADRHDTPMSVLLRTGGLAEIARLDNQATKEGVRR